MRVTPVDPADPWVRQEFHALYAAAHDADLPGEPAPPPALSATWITPTGEADVLTWFAGREDGRLLGAAWLELPRYENAHLAQVDVRVHPAARRRGVGRALVAAARAAGVGGGRTTLSSYARRDGPGAAFAVASGLSAAQAAFRRVLHVAEADVPALDALAAGGEADTQGVGLVGWAGRCPDDLLAGYAAALHGMRDAPTGGFDRQAPAPTGERVRRAEAEALRWGMRGHVAAVRDAATGAVAGFSEVVVHPDSPRAWRSTTVVLAPWRGRGFGLWLKAALLTRVLAAEPHVTRFEAFNAVDNRHMLAVNDRLGYRPAGVWCAFQGPLAS